MKMSLLNQRFRYKKNLYNWSCFLENRISKYTNQVHRKYIKYTLEKFCLLWLKKKKSIFLQANLNNFIKAISYYHFSLLNSAC